MYTIGDDSLAFLNFQSSTNFPFLGGGEGGRGGMVFPSKINKNSVIKVIAGKLTRNCYAPVTREGGGGVEEGGWHLLIFYYDN